MNLRTHNSSIVTPNSPSFLSLDIEWRMPLKIPLPEKSKTLIAIHSLSTAKYSLAEITEHASLFTALYDLASIFTKIKSNSIFTFLIQKVRWLYRGLNVTVSFECLLNNSPLPNPQVLEEIGESCGPRAHKT